MDNTNNIKTLIRSSLISRTNVNLEYAIGDAAPNWISKTKNDDIMLQHHSVMENIMWFAVVDAHNIKLHVITVFTFLNIIPKLFMHYDCQRNSFPWGLIWVTWDPHFWVTIHLHTRDQWRGDKIF